MSADTDGGPKGAPTADPTWWRRVRMDATPLRASPSFRRLFASRAITLLGSQVSEVALLIQVKELTGSPLAVGLLGVAQVVPVVVFSLYGGLLADRFDRRVLALWCEVGLTVVTAALTINALLSRPLLWPLYVGAAAIMALMALQRPSLDAAVPRMLARDQLVAGSALLAAAGNVSFITGPAIAGLLLAGPGAATAYMLDAVSFLVSIVLLLGIAAMPRTGGNGDTPAGLRGVADGIRYAVGRRDLLGSYLVDVAAMTLAYPIALFPFMASDLHAEWAQGLLFSAGAVGALLVSATSGWASRVRRHGRAIALSAAAWGLAIAAAGLPDHIAIALALLVIAGGMDMLSGMFRETLWNQTIPDDLRGRIAGLEVLSYGLGPVAGQVRGGAVAGVFGVRAALWSGGLACVCAVGVICVALPKLWRYDVRAAPGARGAARRAGKGGRAE